jgi:cation transport ATPase
MTNVWRASDVMSDDHDLDHSTYRSPPDARREAFFASLWFPGTIIWLTSVLAQLLPQGTWVLWLYLAAMFLGLRIASRGSFAVWREDHSLADFSSSIDIIRAKATSIAILLGYVLLGIIAFFLAF